MVYPPASSEGEADGGAGEPEATKGGEVIINVIFELSLLIF